MSGRNTRVWVSLNLLNVTKKCARNQRRVQSECGGFKRMMCDGHYFVTDAIIYLSSILGLLNQSECGNLKDFRSKEFSVFESTHVCGQTSVMQMEHRRNQGVDDGRKFLVLFCPLQRSHLLRTIIKSVSICRWCSPCIFWLKL